MSVVTTRALYAALVEQEDEPEVHFYTQKVWEMLTDDHWATVGLE